MNSTLKTIIIVVVVLLVIGAVAKMAGWGFGGRDVVVNDNGMMASSTNQNPGANGTANGGRPAGSNGAASNGNTNAPSMPANSVLSDSALALLINSAVVRVPQTGVDVTLTQGASNYTENAVKGRVTVGRVLAKVATESGFDVFVEMSVTKDGQPAVNRYIAVFQNAGQTVKYNSAVLVGDRVSLTTVTAASNGTTIDNMPKPYMSSSAGYKVTLTYLDRKNGEAPTATPTLSKTMILNVKNHAISK